MDQPNIFYLPIYQNTSRVGSTVGRTGAEDRTDGQTDGRIEGRTEEWKDGRTTGTKNSDVMTHRKANTFTPSILITTNMAQGFS